MERLLIIPAAGRGSRLKSTTPKLLFPVAGRPMLDYLIDLYADAVDRLILVLNPSFVRQIEKYCRRYKLEMEIEIQEQPTGMLEAILAPRELVRRDQPKNIWITWCDQIAISPATVAFLRKQSVPPQQAAMVFPTIIRSAPYTHFQRDSHGQIIKVLHRREGDLMPEVGESDMGLFQLTTDTYLKDLTEFSRMTDEGTVTQEKNFLPFIPWLQTRAEVSTFPGHDPIESLGVNDAEDLHRMESYLHYGH